MSDSDNDNDGLAPKAREIDPESAARTVPPDPEGTNDAYAELAAASLRHFQRHTGSDWDDAPSDFLGDLMHFCDRNGFDFEHELERARRHYEEETAAIDVEPQPDLFQQAAAPAHETPRETIEVRVDNFVDETEVMPSAPERDFLSMGFVVDRIADSLGRTVEMMLGAVYSFFVAEPKMTAQQVHDTLQAAGNVETLHAREVAAAAAVEGEAHEFRMMVAKGEQETRNVYLGMEAGTNATAEATLGLDAYEPQRRKQTQSL
jgi:hypothetical protein